MEDQDFDSPPESFPTTRHYDLTPLYDEIHRLVNTVGWSDTWINELMMHAYVCRCGSEGTRRVGIDPEKVRVTLTETSVSLDHELATNIVFHHELLRDWPKKA